MLDSLRTNKFTYEEGIAMRDYLKSNLIKHCKLPAINPVDNLFINGHTCEIFDWDTIPATAFQIPYEFDPHTNQTLTLEEMIVTSLVNMRRDTKEYRVRNNTDIVFMFRKIDVTHFPGLEVISIIKEHLSTGHRGVVVLCINGENNSSTVLSYDTDISAFIRAGQLELSKHFKLYKDMDLLSWIGVSTKLKKLSIHTDPDPFIRASQDLCMKTIMDVNQELRSFLNDKNIDVKGIIEHTIFIYSSGFLNPEKDICSTFEARRLTQFIAYKLGTSYSYLESIYNTIPISTILNPKYRLTLVDREYNDE